MTTRRPVRSSDLDDQRCALVRRGCRRSSPARRALGLAARGSPVRMIEFGRTCRASTRSAVARFVVKDSMAWSANSLASTSNPADSRTRARSIAGTPRGTCGRTSRGRAMVSERPGRFPVEEVDVAKIVGCHEGETSIRPTRAATAAVLGIGLSLPEPTRGHVQRRPGSTGQSRRAPRLPTECLVPDRRSPNRSGRNA